MTIRTPRLKQNRHGVFCFRLIYTDDQGQRREAVRSLGTKDPAQARLLALQLNLDAERSRATGQPMPNLPRHYNKSHFDGFLQGWLARAEKQK
ncbi:MAG: hypothetical protein LBE81_04490 [Azonexus sp.]|jgi:hypothetical protein|uniref:hypothetical protein n=1 Tax=Azonexus sp. TaxID=1872668 RepID=UPI002835DBB9|nr:hypothetical protein [Azonexus sp.]MDR0775877.1 hypothetical protein [Azonexus sp.]